MTGGSARELASTVRSRQRSATGLVEEALAAIAARNGAINAFTAVTRARALAEAAALGAALAAGRDPGPLAGVPFAVKNLYDVAGLPTIAGSRIDRDRAPAERDAALVRRVTSAGAVLVGALNMDEYAFGFSTENTHYGATRNPRDPTRVAGGSDGGSAAAVAARLVPLTLGSDTNGSIRVPAALCGVFGLRPTFGRLSRAAWYARAQRLRRWYCREMTEASAKADVILAPATPYPAFPIGQTWIELGDKRLPAAGHLGVYTQPLSFTGLPTVVAPVANSGPLPLGVQIVAAPWREDLALRVAAAAVALSVVASPSPHSTEAHAR